MAEVVRLPWIHLSHMKQGFYYFLTELLTVTLTFPCQWQHACLDFSVHGPFSHRVNVSYWNLQLEFTITIIIVALIFW